MNCHWHPTLERIARLLKPSAESFAAAAAVYGPDLMFQLAATPGAVGGPPSPECDGRSHEHRTNLPASATFACGA